MAPLPQYNIQTTPRCSWLQTGVSAHSPGDVAHNILQLVSQLRWQSAVKTTKKTSDVRGSPALSTNESLEPVACPLPLSVAAQNSPTWERCNFSLSHDEGLTGRWSWFTDLDQWQQQRRDCSLNLLLSIALKLSENSWYMESNLNGVTAQNPTEWLGRVHMEISLAQIKLSDVTGGLKHILSKQPGGKKHLSCPQQTVIKMIKAGWWLSPINKETKWIHVYGSYTERHVVIRFPLPAAEISVLPLPSLRCAIWTPHGRSGKTARATIPPPGTGNSEPHT